MKEGVGLVVVRTAEAAFSCLGDRKQAAKGEEGLHAQRNVPITKLACKLQLVNQRDIHRQRHLRLQTTHYFGMQEPAAAAAEELSDKGANFKSSFVRSIDACSKP